MAGTKPLILAVDDEPDVLQLHRRILEPAGYEVITAADGNQALGLVSEKHPELVLLDIKMPGKSGIEVLEELRSNHKDTAVIMVSGIGDTQTAIQAMRMGALDYIVKPFNADEMVLSVERVLERRSLVLGNRDYQLNLEKKVAEQTQHLEQKITELEGVNLFNVKLANERVKALEEMAWQLRFSEAIAAITAAIIEHPQELDLVLNLAMERALGALGIPAGAIYTLDEKAGERHMIASRSISPELARELRTARADEGLGGQVVAAKQPVLIPDVTTAPESAAQPRVKGFRAYAGIPLKAGEKVVGHLMVADPQPHQFTPQEVQFLSTVGHLVGIALENARLSQETEKRAERIQAVQELSSIIGSSLHIQEVYGPFVQALKKVVPADWVSLNQVDKEKRGLRFFALHSEVNSSWASGEAMPLSGTPTEWVIAHRKAFYEADLSQKRQFARDEDLAKTGLKSVVRLPLIAQGEVFGSLMVASREPNAYSQGQLEVLEELAGQIASAISNDQLFEETLRQREELERTLFAGMRAVVLAAESRHPFSYGHADKVTHCARIIAQEMGLTESERRDLEIAAGLHDIGLGAVPDAIINKKGNLTPEERILIEAHPAKGAELLGFSPVFREIAPLVRGHHEHFDGQGYPDGLQGERIPLGARILAVAETYASLTMDSPSRPAFNHQEALDMVKTGAGSRFDPRLVEVFVKALPPQAPPSS